MSHPTRGFRSSPAVLLLVAGAAASSWLAPASLQAQKTPSFQEKLDVNLVNVDIVVVDKQGNLVSDLDRDDFQITDDGKKVSIDYFAALAGTAAATAPAAPQAGQAEADAGSAGDAGSDLRHIILFIDTDSELPTSRNRVLGEVSDYLAAHAGSTDAMVVTYGGSGLDIKQPFTTSPAAWSAAIAAAKEMPSRGMVRQSEQHRMLDSIKTIQRNGDNGKALQSARDQLDELMGSVRTYAQEMQMDGLRTIHALQTLASVLSTVPGPKSLIYVGDGVPVHPGDELYNLIADVFESDTRFGEQGGRVVASNGPNPTEVQAPGNEGDQGSGVGTSDFGGLPPVVGPMAESTQRVRTDAFAFDLTPDLRALTATANSHRVTLYGLSTDSPGGAARGDLNLGTRVPASVAMNYDVARSQVREQSLQLIAQETGGLTLPANAGVPAFLDRVLADHANQYSLAYLSPHGGDSRFHKIKVKVNRKGVELRHREGYIDRPRDVRIGDLVAGALLLGSGENPHRLEMEVTSQTPAENDQIAVTISLRIPIDELHLVPAGEQQEAKLDLYVLSKDAKGTMAPMRNVAFTVVVPNARLAESKGMFYGATLPLSLPRGPHAVAVGIVEELAQRTSVVRTDLLVGGDAQPLPAAPKS